MKSKIRNLIELIYTKLFGMKTTPAIYQFISNFTWVMFGIIISKALIMLISLLGGRILGPAEFGKYQLIYSIALILLVPMLMGSNTTIVKYASPLRKLKEIRSVISSSLSIFFMSSAAIVLIAIFFSGFFTDILSIDQRPFFYAVLLALGLCLYYLSQHVLQALDKLKQLSIFEMISSLLALALFFILIRTLQNYFSFYIPVLAGFVVFTVLTVLVAWKYILRFKPSKSRFRMLIKYGFFSMLLSLGGTVLGNIDKILINKFLGQESVGIFQAYSIGSIVAVNILTSIFITVFFPAASRYSDKFSILKRLDRLCIIAGLLIVVSIPFLEYVVLKLFGSSYYISLPLMIAFSIASALYFVDLSYIWLFSSIGQVQMKKSAYSFILATMISIVLNILLIPRFELMGSVISYIIASLIPLTYVRFALHKITKKEAVIR